jgi:hypothetical protein
MDGIIKWEIKFGWRNLVSHYIEHARMEHYFKVIKRRHSKGLLLKGNWDSIKRYQPWNESFDESIRINQDGLDSYIHPIVKKIKKIIYNYDNKITDDEISDELDDEEENEEKSKTQNRTRNRSRRQSGRSRRVTYNTDDDSSDEEEYKEKNRRKRRNRTVYDSYSSEDISDDSISSEISESDESSDESSDQSDESNKSDEISKFSRNIHQSPDKVEAAIIRGSKRAPNPCNRKNTASKMAKKKLY